MPAKKEYTAKFKDQTVRFVLDAVGRCPPSNTRTSTTFATRASLWRLPKARIRKAIQERLGHSSIRLTLDRYGHLFPSLDETMQEGLDRVPLEASAASLLPGASNALAPETGQRPGEGR